jgi:predicted anti-sigma-YlaC factor YlaD
MSDHDEIRKLLALAAAGALEEADEERVLSHARTCSECSQELESWQSLAAGLRAVPTPQPSAALIQRTRAVAEARLEEETEARWQRNVMIFVLAFAWVLTIVSWPLVRIATRGLAELLNPHLNQTWVSFAGSATLVWLTGGIAAVLLALKQRRERRLA